MITQLDSFRLAPRIDVINTVQRSIITQEGQGEGQKVKVNLELL